MGYSVEQELSLPPQVYRHGVSPQVLEAVGIAPDTPQESLLLAELAITGARYGGKWLVTASSSASDVRLGQIWCNDGTNREEVLPTAYEWVRESEASAWVPGHVVELPLPETFAPYAAHGIILVRGHKIPKDLLAKAQEPRQKDLHARTSLGQRAMRLFRRK